MAYSRQSAVSDGTLQSIGVSLKYFKRDDLSVLLNGVLTEDWEWLGVMPTIVFPAPIANGVEVVIIRNTQLNKVIHEFSLGAKFVNSSVDDDFRQMLYLAQEYTEQGGRTDFFNDINMHGFRIRNLAGGVLDSDAATVGQLNSVSGDAVAAAAAANAAAANATAAANAAGMLRAELASPTGASLVTYTPLGGNSTTIAARLNIQYFASEYVSVQAAHDALVLAGGGTLWIDGKFPMPNGFRWNYNKVQVLGTCSSVSELDFTGMTGPVDPDVDMFAIEWEDPGVTKSRKTMGNLILTGPAASVGISCLPLFSEVGDAITNFNFHGVTVVDFETQLYFGSQCSNIYFSQCHFTNSGANFRTSTVIKTSTAPVANGGECWNFSQCQLNNVKTIIENNSGIAGGWSFDQCALVYFEACFDLRSPCRVTVGGGSHIESNTYARNWFSTNGNGCLIRIDHTEFWFAGVVTKELFLSNPDTVFGGIFIEDCDYHADGFAINYLADQSQMGPIYVDKWRCQDSITIIPFGANPGVQLEAWPTSSINFANAFKADTADASTIGITEAQPYEGDVTQVSTTLAGQVMQGYKRYPVKGGGVVSGAIFVKTTGFDADNSSLGLYVTVLDGDGTYIGGGQVLNLVSADLDNYTKVVLNWYPTLPKGAAFYEFRMYASPATGANPRSVFFGGMVINQF